MCERVCLAPGPDRRYASFLLYESMLTTRIYQLEWMGRAHL